MKYTYIEYGRTNQYECKDEIMYSSALGWHSINLKTGAIWHKGLESNSSRYDTYSTMWELVQSFIHRWNYARLVVEVEEEQ